MLVVIEGMDASGKATQVKKLVERFRADSRHVETQDFPDYNSFTGKAIGELLRQEWGIFVPEGDWLYQQVMSDARRKELRAMVLQSLMTTNRLERAHHLKTFAQSRAWNMVLDRYFASGMVYGQADGLSLDWLVRIHQTIPQPDLWVFIDIPPEESIRRRPDRRDEYEKRPGLMEKVRELYLDLFEKGRNRVLAEMGLPSNPQNYDWVVVDGMGTMDEVSDRIWKAVVDHPLGPRI